MPVTFYVRHLYHHPVEVVAKAHLGKYPNKEEANIFAVDTLQHRYEPDGSVYWQRIAQCTNFIPLYLRRLHYDLDKREVLVQEECWLRNKPRRFILMTRMLTWKEYARTNLVCIHGPSDERFVVWSRKQHEWLVWNGSMCCTVDVDFYPAEENAEWTVFEQRGKIDIHGLKLLGPLVERIALKFFNAGAAKVGIPDGCWQKPAYYEKFPYGR